MSTLWQDLRFCFHSFRKTPGFTLVVVLTLALGIGANTAIFSVLNAAVLRPLPYPQPERLAMVFTQFPNMEGQDFNLSVPEFYEYQSMTQSFDTLTAFWVGTASLSEIANPKRVNAFFGTADLWPVLGVEPHLGRVYNVDEDVPGPASDVAVLSHELWTSTYNADPALIGQTIQVDSVAITVLGIMPPGFDLLENDIDIWLPLALDPANPGFRAGHNYRVAGRLKENVSIQQVNAELATCYEQWDSFAANQHHPTNDESIGRHPMVIHPLSVIAFGDTRPAMFLLLGIVGFILLIASANVANLLLARAEVRQRELALRLALGAQKWRVIRQLFTESIALAVLGGAVGLLLAWWILEIMLVFIPTSLPRADEISIDPAVLIFTMIVSLGTGVLFGLAPVLRLRMPRLHAALKSTGSRSSSAGAEHHRFRNLLVISEIALALVLITGAGLMIRSFSRLQNVDPGFDPTGVMTMGLYLPPNDYADNDLVTAFYNDLVREVKALPGVQTAAVSSGLPPRRNASLNNHLIESYQGIPMADPNFDFMQIASADYFEALGIPLKIGRLYDENDTLDAEPVMVINQALAERYWPSDGKVSQSIATDDSQLVKTNPLEDRIADWNNPPNWFRIVGIVGNAKQGGMENEIGTENFIPFEQIARFGFVPRDMNLIVRSESSDPLAQLGPVTDIIRRMDETLPISNIQTMDQAVYDSIATQRFAAVLLLSFGLLATCLATVGIYSVMAFSVAQRTNEFGIRMALGAQTGHLMKNVLFKGVMLTIIGILLGVGITVTLVKSLSVFFAFQLDGFLFELSPNDPITLIAVSSLLMVTAIIACLVPARRATRVDPMVALRYE